MTVELGMRLKGITQAERAMVNMLRGISKEVEKTSKRIEELTARQKRMSEMKMRSDAFRALPSQVKDATKSIDDMTSSIYRSAQRWRTFGYLASIALTAPIVYAGKKSIETASDFEYSMNKIVGLVGVGRKEVEGFKKEIMDMSMATGQSTTKLAEGLYYITSAGFKKGAEALRILEVAARGSTAGLGDLVDMSKLLVFSMNAYRKSGYSATQVADIFVAAVREGALEAGDFAGAMQSVIPIASGMGVSLEQVAGSMAAMSLQGASAQNAAVYLKGMLNALLKIKPNNMAGKSLAKMGVNVDDLLEKLKSPGGLMRVLMQLQELSKKSTGNQFLKEIFRDIRAMTGELSLTGENLEYNQFVMNEVENAAGDLARADKAVANGMDKLRKVASATGEIIRIKLGDDLAAVVLPALQSLLNTVQGIIKAFDRLEPATKKVIIQVLGLIAALGPLALFGSLLKYAYGGFLSTFVRGFIFARNVVGALNGDLIKMGKLMKNTPKLAGGAKAFNVWRLGGGGANLGKALVSAPVVLLSTAVAVGTVAFFRYAKRIREAAEAARSFNSMQVTVNDTVKAFNEMDKSDIEQMTLDEMMLAKAKAAQVWADSYKMYKQYEKNLEEGAGSRYWNKKYMQEEADAVEFAKKQYDNLTASIYEMQKRLVADRARAKRVEDLKKTKAENEAITKVMQDMYDALAQVDQQAKAMAAISKPFDIAEEKARILLKALDELTGGDIRLHFESKEVQEVTKLLKALGIDFTKADEITENFAADLARIDMKKLLLGNEFDANAAKLQVYQKQLDSFLDVVLDPKKRTLGPTPEDIKQIDEYVKGINEARDASQAFEDEQLLKFLNAQASAFGGVENQIEVLNAQLQIAERKLRKIGEMEGFSENFIRQGEIVNKSRDALYRLNEEADLQWLVDMNNAMENSTSQMKMLEGFMSAIEQRMQIMSKAGLGTTKVFQDMADKLKTLNRAKEVIDILGDSFERVFRDMLEGGKNFSEIMVGIFRDLVSKIMAELTKAMIFKIVMAIVTRGASVPGSVMVAKGGVVPQGYPNDSYPALLTSGETVLPEKLTSAMFKGNDDWSGQVVFEIEGDRLVGILKKKSKQNSLY